MKWIVIPIFLFAVSVQAQRLNRYKFLKPFQTCYNGSEDIGLSFEWLRSDRVNSYGIGGYYSVQSSPLGAGIWYHVSGFGSVSFVPDKNAQNVNLNLGANCGVSFLILEVKARYNLSQASFSFVPAVGLGLNRIVYGMFDYYIQKGQNQTGFRLVLRLPVLTRVDKNLSGVTPAYH